MSDALFDLRCAVRPRAQICGVALPVDRSISRYLRRRIVDEGYEWPEMNIVRAALADGDRVLECGTGLGFLAAYCARRLGNDRVRSFEANPGMSQVIRATFALNGVAPALVEGAIGAQAGSMALHVNEDFWATTGLHGRDLGYLRTITVPVFELHAEVLEFRPTFLLIDIEGGEEQLAGSSDLPGVRKVMAEVHPELIGVEGVSRFTGWLESIGFELDRSLSRQDELLYRRP